MKLRTRHLYTGVVLALIYLVTATNSTTAQGYLPILRSGGIRDVSWSADSQLLSFYQGDSPQLESSDNGTWYQYDPATEILTDTDEWALQPQLSSTEENLFNPAEKGKFRAFIFESPDENFIVYPSGELTERGIPIYLAKRSNQTVAETYTITWQPYFGINSFNVVWNQTSTAFIVSTEPADGGADQFVQAHVSGFSTTVTGLTVLPINLVISGDHYGALIPHSISDDGNKVLFTAADLDSSTAGNPILRLVIWNTETLATSVVGSFDATTIIAASFEDGNADKVLLVNANGVLRYTVSTQQTATLNTLVTSTWGHTASFSNNGEWLAVVRYEGVGDAVYVFDLVEDFSATPTPTATGLKLEYYPESTTRTLYVEAIIPQLNIVNNTSSAVNLSELKIRYYFTKDSTTQSLQGVCAYTALSGNCANVNVTTGSLMTPIDRADSYIEVGFTSGTLAANSETQDIIVRANKQDWSDFDQGNDYSFDQLSTSDTFIEWTRVTLYRNSTLVWGVEPE